MYIRQLRILSSHKDIYIVDILAYLESEYACTHTRTHGPHQSEVA